MHRRVIISLDTPSGPELQHHATGLDGRGWFKLRDDGVWITMREPGTTPRFAVPQDLLAYVAQQLDNVCSATRVREAALGLVGASGWPAASDDSSEEWYAANIVYPFEASFGKAKRPNLANIAFVEGNLRYRETMLRPKGRPTIWNRFRKEATLRIVANAIKKRPEEPTDGS